MEARTRTTQRYSRPLSLLPSPLSDSSDALSISSLLFLCEKKEKRFFLFSSLRLSFHSSSSSPSPLSLPLCVCVRACVMLRIHIKPLYLSLYVYIGKAYLVVVLSLSAYPRTPSHYHELKPFIGDAEDTTALLLFHVRLPVRKRGYPSFVNACVRANDFSKRNLLTFFFLSPGDSDHRTVVSQGSVPPPWGCQPACSLPSGIGCRYLVSADRSGLALRQRDSR